MGILPRVEKSDFCRRKYQMDNYETELQKLDSERYDFRGFGRCCGQPRFVPCLWLERPACRRHMEDHPENCLPHTRHRIDIGCVVDVAVA